MNIESLLKLLVVPHDPYLYMPPRHHPPVTGKTLTKIMHGNCVVKLPARLTPPVRNEEIAENSQNRIVPTNFQV